MVSFQTPSRCLIFCKHEAILRYHGLDSYHVSLGKIRTRRAEFRIVGILQLRVGIHVETHGNGGMVSIKAPATISMRKAASAINIFLGLFIIFLPMPQLAKLALSLRRKIQIMLMFRHWILHYRRQHSPVEIPHPVWEYTKSHIIVEIHMGTICSCMPALRALVRS